MMFVSGSKMFYIAKNISIQNLCTIIRSHAAKVSLDSAPTIYIDTSWLGRKLSTGYSSSVSHIIEVVQEFNQEDIFVVLVMDNQSVRHHSKKPTTLQKKCRASMCRQYNIANKAHT